MPGLFVSLLDDCGYWGGDSCWGDQCTEMWDLCNISSQDILSNQLLDLKTDYDFVQNKSFVQKNDKIASCSEPDGRKRKYIITAPIDGVIYWIFCKQEFNDNFIFPISTLNHDQINMYIDTNKDDFIQTFEHKNGHRQYAIAGVISNEYDNTDDIVDWIVTQQIKLPKKFVSKNEEGEYIYNFKTYDEYMQMLEELTYAVE